MAEMSAVMIPGSLLTDPTFLAQVRSIVTYVRGWYDYEDLAPYHAALTSLLRRRYLQIYRGPGTHVDLITTSPFQLTAPNRCRALFPETHRPHRKVWSYFKGAGLAKPCRFFAMRSQALTSRGVGFLTLRPILGLDILPFLRGLWAHRRQLEDAYHALEQESHVRWRDFLGKRVAFTAVLKHVLGLARLEGGEILTLGAKYRPRRGTLHPRFPLLMTAKKRYHAPNIAHGRLLKTHGTLLDPRRGIYGLPCVFPV